MAEKFDENIKRALKRLGLKGNPSIDEIDKAYRKRAKETHPDMSNGSNEEFIHVQRAYDFLKKFYQESLVEESKERGLVPYKGAKPKGGDIVPYEGGEGRRGPPSGGGEIKAIAPRKKPRAILGSISGPQSRRGEIVWSLVMIIAGLTVSAIIGTMWIFFAFLSLALYIIVPSPEEVLGRNLSKIKTKYIKKIEGASQEETEKIKIALEQDLANARSTQRIKAELGLVRWGASSLKYLFKAGFFVFFSLGFITSSIPLLKPLGIFLAFIGYFAEG